MDLPHLLLSAGTRRGDHLLSQGRLLRTLRVQYEPSRPQAKKARTLGPGESSRASEPPADFEVSTNLSPESIMRRPMLTAPPIEGNSDCRARPFRFELYFDQEAMQQQLEL